jgi:hypothetical protein
MVWYKVMFLTAIVDAQLKQTAVDMRLEHGGFLLENFPGAEQWSAVSIDAIIRQLPSGVDRYLRDNEAKVILSALIRRGYLIETLIGKYALTRTGLDIFLRGELKMPNITMCVDRFCPSCATCLRYVSKASKPYQEYAIFKRGTHDKCMYYWKVKEEDKK